MKSFDLVIIGGGAAAFGAAIKANDLGARAAMINRGLPLGGTCVNVGCVPSKTLLRAAEILHLAKHHDIPGIELEVNAFDFATVVRDELALVERLRREKYEKVLDGLEHVTFIDGDAHFISATDIVVNGEAIAARKSSSRPARRQPCRPFQAYTGPATSRTSRRWRSSENPIR